MLYTCKIASVNVSKFSKTSKTVSYIIDKQFFIGKKRIWTENFVRNFVRNFVQNYEKYVRKFFRRSFFAEVFSPNLYPPKLLGINVSARWQRFKSVSCYCVFFANWVIISMKTIAILGPSLLIFCLLCITFASEKNPSEGLNVFRVRRSKSYALCPLYTNPLPLLGTRMTDSKLHE